MSFFVCALRIPGVIFSMRYIYTFHVSVSWCNQIHHMISSWSCYLNICFLFPILNWLPSAWFHLGSLFLFYLLQKGMLCGKHCTWEVEGGNLCSRMPTGKKKESMQFAFYHLILTIQSQIISWVALQVRTRYIHLLIFNCIESKLKT